VESALAGMESLTTPRAIRVWENRKYPEILDWIFE
jgi:hypothetical protein